MIRPWWWSYAWEMEILEILETLEILEILVGWLSSWRRKKLFYEAILWKMKIYFCAWNNNSTWFIHHPSQSKPTLQPNKPITIFIIKLTNAIHHIPILSSNRTSVQRSNPLQSTSEIRGINLPIVCILGLLIWNALLLPILLHPQHRHRKPNSHTRHFIPLYISNRTA